jgi:hypothetical protein
MTAYNIWPYHCVDTMLHILDEKSVHCCVTSPPYFGLRDYGHAGQIGLEPTPDEYVAAMVGVFRAVRRVLRDDGTVWLNLGDSYANDSKWGGATGGKHAGALHGATDIGRGRVATGLKAKELIGIPWRVAFALQADGWYLRQDIIWNKPNPMPESVRDRCTKAHEYIFLLTKSPRYFFDAEAIKEQAECFRQRGSGPMVNAGTGRNDAATGTRGDYRNRPSVKQGGFGGKGPIPGSGQSSFRAITATRNKRSVWTVTPKPFKGAHFATFPPDLIEPCILAGSPTACCAACGAPRVAVVERKAMVINRSTRRATMGAKGVTQSSGAR